MTRNSIFEIWEMPKHAALMESLAALPPDRTWQIMAEIREAELAKFEQREMEAIRQRALRTLRLAPAMAAHDIDDVATDFARYVRTRYLDCVFLGIYAKELAADVDFARKIWAIRDGEHLEWALSDGGVILLPLHMGPFPCLLGMLAMSLPVTTLVEAVAKDDFQRVILSYLPQVDLEMIGMPDRRVLLRCLRAIQGGRVLAMFPEFSWGYDQPGIRAPLLGASVAAPMGPARLAQRTGRKLVLCHVVRGDDGHYDVRYYPPIAVGPGTEGISDAIAETFSVIERAVMEHPAQWLGWNFFDEMTATDADGPLRERVLDRR